MMRLMRLFNLSMYCFMSSYCRSEFSGSSSEWKSSISMCPLHFWSLPLSRSDSIQRLEFVFFYYIKRLRLSKERLRMLSAVCGNNSHNLLRTSRLIHIKITSGICSFYLPVLSAFGECDKVLNTMLDLSLFRI